MEEENTKKILENDKSIHIKSHKARKWIVLAFLILTFIVSYVSYRGEYLEVLELGEQYLSIFWQNLTSFFATFIINALAIYILVYWTNKRIRKGLKLFFEKDKKTMPKMINKSISFVIAVVISFFTTNIILEKYMLCANATAFGITDSILGYDIGYFIFIQPFVQYILYYILFIALGLTVYAVIYYIIAFNKYFDGIDRDVLKQGFLFKQFYNNIISITVILASIVFIETLNVGLQKILTLQNGLDPYVLWGAGISEVTIKMWGYRILSAIIIISVCIAIHYLKKKNTRKVITSLLVVPAYLMTMLIILIGFNTIFVNQNELDNQQEYIRANINATKQAYGIDIDEISLEEDNTINIQELDNNANVVNNIALVSKEAVLKNLNISQTNKGYYTYRTAQIANYTIDEQPRLVYVCAREMGNSTSTYNNKTYEYTHGYGTIIASATSVDENGNIKYLQKDFNENQITQITEPRIYFGLETNNTVVTNNKNIKEFDYPITTSSKNQNAENVYDGKAGLKLKFLDRLILAIKEKDLKLAFSKNVNKDSNILINRNIIERAKTLMPDITYDENPYIITTEEGKMMWVLDGYTTSAYYPYSQKISLNDGLINKEQINYIRNSVKVLIDAYDGTIKYYITDRNDPIIMAYQKMYKDLFANKNEKIPEYISNQFMYSQFLYNIQSEIIERYHNVETDVLYRGDDIWNIATHNTTKVTTKTGVKIEPYYAMVKLKDQKELNIGLVLPYTPYQKQNLISYLVGSYIDGEPKLTVYKYPSDSNILGPMQLDNQIDQDETISKEIETLNITGTKISKNMIIIPINDTLLYVEPIYQQYINEDNTTPILKKVVVASGNKVAIGNSIEDALQNLVSQEAVKIEIEDTDTEEGIIQAIIKTNNNLKQSNSKNNWEMTGKDMSRLQELITKLEQLQKLKKKNKTNTKNVEIVKNTIEQID